MNNKTLLILNFLFLIASSCSNHKIKLTHLTENFSIRHLDSSRSQWARLQKFQSEDEAFNYALDRRITIQRFHQLKSEPYFGTPSQKECSENLNLTGMIENIHLGKYFYLKVLVNNQFAMGDCLKENNTREAFYEFYICNNGDLIEVRHFQNFNSPTPALKKFQCGDN